MRVTKWGEYGILCCLYLARRSGEPSVGANDVAEAQRIPFQYTQQILQRLRKGGIITSIRGPQGGYLLARPASEINLRQILHAAEGRTFELICDESPIYSECESSGCGLRRVWSELKNSIDTLLEGHTLDVLLDRHELLAAPMLVAPPKSQRIADGSKHGTISNVDQAPTRTPES